MCGFEQSRAYAAANRAGIPLPRRDMLETSVFHFTLHTALNLLWLAISVCAFTWFWRSERKRPRLGRWHRLFAVCALCITLFPSVSDTDDLFNFSLMQVP